MTIGLPDKFQRHFKTLREIANYAQMHGSPEECFLVDKFGENSDIDAGQTEDIWAYGGDRPKPGAAEQFNIVSTDVDDTATDGTGTRVALVQGLDANYDLAEEYVNMNGTTNVLTTTSFINIHRLLSATVGSSEGNEGTITATGATSSNVMASVTPTYNITQMSHYMVPRNYTAYILDTTLSAYKADGSGTRQAELSLWIQVPDFAEYRTNVRGINSATFEVEFPAGIVTREKSLIWFKGTAATNNTSVSAQYSLLCINKDWVRNP